MSVEIESLFNKYEYDRGPQISGYEFVTCQLYTANDWKPYCDCTDGSLKHPCVIDCLTIGCKGWYDKEK